MLRSIRVFSRGRGNGSCGPLMRLTYDAREVNAYVKIDNADGVVAKTHPGWNFNWDMRSSIDSKVSHQIVLIRHGKYVVDEDQGNAGHLTDIGMNK